MNNEKLPKCKACESERDEARAEGWRAGRDAAAEYLRDIDVQSSLRRLAEQLRGGSTLAHREAGRLAYEEADNILQHSLSRNGFALAFAEGQDHGRLRGIERAAKVADDYAAEAEKRQDACGQAHDYYAAHYADHDSRAAWQIADRIRAMARELNRDLIADRDAWEERAKKAEKLAAKEKEGEAPMWRGVRDFTERFEEECGLLAAIGAWPNGSHATTIEKWFALAFEAGAGLVRTDRDTAVARAEKAEATVISVHTRLSLIVEEHHMLGSGEDLDTIIGTIEDELAAASRKL